MNIIKKEWDSGNNWVGIIRWLICVFSSDIDECSNSTDSCDSNANCTNTEGSFTCQCNDGYEGDGTVCAGNFFILCVHS